MANEDSPIVCEVTDEDMRTRVGYQLETQVSLFEGVCNIYVPYYRQAAASYYFG